MRTTPEPSVVQRLRAALRRILGEGGGAPSPAWRGATWGMLATTALATAAMLRDASPDGPSLLYGLGVTLPSMIAIAVAAAAGAVIFVRVAGAVPLGARAAFFGCAVLLIARVLAGPTLLLERLVPAAFILGSGALVGGGAGLLVTRRRKVEPLATLGMGLFLAASAIHFAVSPGVEDLPVVDAAKLTAVTVPQLDLPDPSAPGPFAVKRLTYGSGLDRRRPEYGAGAALRTKPVDATPFFRGWQGGIASWARTRYWGFGPRDLPIDARVFYPDAPGPRPVVVLVHGGHPMGDFSEPGYDYLGEHLASHGFVAVLVDENFLNGGAMGDAGITGENAARGWIVLQHLEALRGFSSAQGNPLSGRIDVDHVVLLGHSKGGEAIVAAAILNRLPRYPDDATIPTGQGFGIRGLVALSVTDKQLEMGGVPMALEDVSYLALQGSNDGDVEYFQGAQQMERVRFTHPGDAFKASVYVHRASHGQWNRVWGSHDKSGLLRRIYFNRRPLLAAEDQERIAKVYVTAFAQATLAGDRRWLPLFHDPRAGARWLPDTIYVGRFAGASWRIVAAYDEDVDVTTTTLPGGSISAEDLTVWREGKIGSMPALADTRGVLLGWDRDALLGVPSYTVTLPPGGAGVGVDGAVVLSLADADLPPNPRRLRGAPAYAPSGRGPRQPIDLTVELVDEAGHAARVALADVRLVQPQLDATVWKGWFSARRPPDTVLGTWEIPLARFAAPGFDPAHLHAVRLVFDRTAAGVVALKDVGFRPAEDYAPVPPSISPSLR